MNWQLLWATAGVIPLFWLFQNIYCLFVNWRIARATGIPYLIIPVSPDNPVWMLIGEHVTRIFRALFGESTFTRYCSLGWEYYDKHRIHRVHGDVIILTSPKQNWVHVCNGEAIHDILQRRSDFPRPAEMLAVLDVFGPNISTAQGVDWQRQRKITSTPFNEQNNNIVWIEALRQSKEMLEYWNSENVIVRTTAKDMRTLSLHVLSNAGCGKSYGFRKASEPPNHGHTFNYRDSLALILEHILLILVVGTKFLQYRFIPRKWRLIGQATSDFRAYMTDMLNDEKRHMDLENSGDSNLVTSLIRASEDRMRDPAIGGGGKGLALSHPENGGLTEDEIYGNIFVYNFAGHDTMAITMNWAIYLLAANPGVQEWIAEEINALLPNPNNETWNYATMYPKFNRVFAVMLEVLRLWNPLMGIAKCTLDEPQPLSVNGQTYMIPPYTYVIPNINAVHCSPRYWGSEDPLVWRPQRWIQSSTTSPDPAAHTFPSRPIDGPALERESLFTPSKGAYVPWSDGARGCPGKKFGQVQFVATIATLFRDHRVDPVPELEGETVEMARRRALKGVQNSGMVFLLQMLNPEKIGLRWRKVDQTRKS